MVLHNTAATVFGIDQEYCLLLGRYSAAPLRRIFLRRSTGPPHNKTTLGLDNENEKKSDQLQDYLDSRRPR